MAQALGGVFDYSGQSPEEIVGNFINNSVHSDYAAHGGAIYLLESTVSTIQGKFTGNYATTITEYCNGSSNGGAIYINYGSSITSIEATFTDNYVESSIAGGFYNGQWNPNGGGAIYNYGKIESIDNCVFDSNAAYAVGDSQEIMGGAILNDGSITTITNSTFSNNLASATYSYGGAICHFGYDNSAYDENWYYLAAPLELVNQCSFTNNQAGYGGAIYALYVGPDYGNIELISNSTFTANLATYDGGAINIDGSCLDTINTVSFTGNIAGEAGGAILNSGSITNIVASTFKGNEATDGGAIANWDSIDLISDSLFDGNYASSTGGAISQWGAGLMTISTSTFENNKADSSGGAIYIYAEDGYGPYAATIIDTSFTDNSAGLAGGAIYNGDTLNLIASSTDVTFSGNTANNVSNALAQGSSATTNIYASSDAAGSGMVVFNDGISGTGVININGDIDNTSYAGTVVLNADMSDYSGAVNFSQGTIVVGAEMGETDGYTNFFSGSFTVASTPSISSYSITPSGSTSYNFSATLDAGNGVLDKFDLTDWDTSAGLGLVIDIDLTSQISDFFDVYGEDISQLIEIEYILLTDDLTEESAYIYISDADAGFSLSDSIGVIQSDQYQYNVSAAYLVGEEGHADGFYLYFEQVVVPEPSTATLSLLALAGLCARRRRRG